MARTAPAVSAHVSLQERLLLLLTSSSSRRSALQSTSLPCDRPVQAAISGAVPRQPSRPTGPRHGVVDPGDAHRHRPRHAPGLRLALRLWEVLFFSSGDRFIQTIPGVGAVYNTVKQIVDTFSSDRHMFKVVLVEFPRKGCWTIGFLTNTVQGEAQARANTEVWTVFVPTTPNPTSGFLLIFPGPRSPSWTCLSATG